MTSSDLWDAESAARYDETSAEMFSPEVLGPAVDFLARLAGDGAALELAIGTGRVGVPLRARGVPVTGIELSAPMVEQLRQKPGGDRLPVTVGDMATTRVPNELSLVYLVYNTIGNVLTQDGQVEVFRNAAERLADDGVFVVENLTPWESVPSSQFVHAEEVAAGHVVLDVNRYDRATQLLSENHVRIDPDGIRMGPIEQRLTTPAELDLMARVAGLRLHARYGGCRREPFTSASTLHVSVYGR
jgi:SAM-dependent methyltransferase